MSRSELNVNMNDDSFGSKKPITVRLKPELTKGGINALIVSIKKEVGQKR